MKPFNLQEYLENPNRKVTTRLGGREVRIICWDRKDNNNRPIITLMKDTNGNEYTTYHTINGFVDETEKYIDKRDLFFADDEVSQEFIDEYQFNTICHHLDMKKELFKKDGNQTEQDRWQGLLDWLKSKKHLIVKGDETHPSIIQEGKEIQDWYNLRFATKSDDEEELSEFESELYSTISDVWQDYMLDKEVNLVDTVKEHSNSLLELAKKELEKKYYNDKFNITAKNFSRLLCQLKSEHREIIAKHIQEVVDKTKDALLETLPKWRDVLHDKDFYLHEKLDDYFVKDILHPSGEVKERWVLKKSDLEKLPRQGEETALRMGWQNW